MTRIATENGSVSGEDKSAISKPVRAAILAFFVTVALGAAGLVAYRQFSSGAWKLPDGDDLVRLPRRLRGEPAPRVMKTVYLHRGGITLLPGRDDSSRGISSVVREAGKAKVVIPRFRGGAKQWRQLVACVRDQYAPFDVTVTDERPEEKGYVLVAVGGQPKLLGYPSTTGGLAPYSGEPVEDPVVFVFSDSLGGRTQIMCETAAMEIAHAYGLDHEYLCKDPMSYLTGCGKKTFQDKEVPCGEKKPRECGDGKPTQNSYARLMSLLGPRKEARR